MLTSKDDKEEEVVTLSSPKKKLRDAKKQAEYFEKESNKAEVQQITRSLSEHFVNKAMTSALLNLPTGTIDVTSNNSNHK